MTEQQTKPKKPSMVQQSIEAARNAPAFTPEVQATLNALVIAHASADEQDNARAILQRAHALETERLAA
ncbi:MAG TPA: hypothetical protein DCQ77_10960 [Betaproteobacteria bacterium]|nr:hypothetical protein [Betaproteobacteria bacterium]